MNVYQVFHIWDGEQEGKRVAQETVRWQSYFVFGALSLRNVRDISRFNKVVSVPWTDLSANDVPFLPLEGIWGLV